MKKQEQKKKLTPVQLEELGRKVMTPRILKVIGKKVETLIRQL
jgi:hypothetical protein